MGGKGKNKKQKAAVVEEKPAEKPVEPKAEQVEKKQEKQAEQKIKSIPAENAKKEAEDDKQQVVEDCCSSGTCTKQEHIKKKEPEESKGQEDPNDIDAIQAKGSAMGSWGQQTEAKQQEDIEMQQRLQAVMQMSKRLQENKGRMDPRQRKYIERQIKLMKPHAFWDNQPVRNLKNRASIPNEDGPIEKKQIKDVPTEAQTLPQGYEWCTIDLNDDEDANQLYTLLNEHYVEDSEGIFRFDYSIGLIRWVLLTPDYIKDWHVGVRNSKNKKLLGFISGTPYKVQANKSVVKMAEINFLCVNKKLRQKKMAPLLIKEVTRRVNLNGIWSAIYTSGDTFPTPFSEANYFHRTLNPKKNVETGFSSLSANETMAKYVKKMKIHEMKDINLIGEPRLMTTKDLPQVYALYKKQMEKAKVSFKFSQQELSHHLMPVQGIVYTIVIENEQEKKITDFVSFYNLPSQILKQQGHNYTHMNVAYLYYYGTSVNSLTEVMKYGLLFAKELVPDGTRFDVFNCLNIMDNRLFLQDLKFGVGDGILNYYMYNYILGEDLAHLNPTQLGTVLV